MANIMMTPAEGQDFLTSVTSGVGEDPIKKQPSKTITLSREIARQQTRLVAPSRSLFDVLSPEARNKAIQVQKEGNLYTEFVDGIDGTDLTSKIIIALAQELNKQSETQYLEGIGKKIKQWGDKAEDVVNENGISLRDWARSINPDEKGVAPGKTEDGQPIYSISPYILIKLNEFTRLVKGMKKGEKVSTSDRNEVADALERMDSKRVYFEVEGLLGKGKRKRKSGHFGTSLLHIEWDYIIDGARRICIKLNPIFTRKILNDFITVPADILERLRGRQPKITMRLFFYLIEKQSYLKQNESLYYIEPYADELFDRIAVEKQYERKPSLKLEKLKAAVAKMEDIGLLVPDTFKRVEVETLESGTTYKFHFEIKKGF